MHIPYAFTRWISIYKGDEETYEDIQVVSKLLKIQEFFFMRYFLGPIHTIHIISPLNLRTASVSILQITH